MCYYLRGGAVLNFAGTVEAPVSEESWTLKFPWETLKADFAGWHPAIQAIIDAADRNECYRWSLHNRPPIRTWSKGHITILGDAAHPTLPYLAQGAAMAIEDGAVLARALERESSIAQALDVFQRNRVDRTSRVVAQLQWGQSVIGTSIRACCWQVPARGGNGRGSGRWSWRWAWRALNSNYFSDPCSRVLFREVRRQFLHGTHVVAHSILSPPKQYRPQHL